MTAADIAEVLIGFGARVLPSEDRERWREEWLAEMAAESATGRSQLLFSLDACAAATAMACDCRRRRALTRAATAAAVDTSRPFAVARPPYNAGVEFWS